MNTQGGAFFDPNQPTPGAGQAPRSYYDLMLSLSDLGAKERGLKDQMEMAQELRGTAMPGMRGQYGRVQTAAHPLEFLNAGLRQAGGGQLRRQVASQQEMLAQEIRRRIAEERAKQQQGGMGQVPMGNPGIPIPTTRGA